MMEKTKRVREWKGRGSLNKGPTFKIEDGKGNKAEAYYNVETKQFYLNKGNTSINGEVDLEEILEKYNPQIEHDLVFWKDLISDAPLLLEYGEVKIWIQPKYKYEKKKFYERG